MTKYDSQSGMPRSAHRGMTVEASNLAKRYGQVVAVHQVDFTARPTRILGLLGPNGAGKSTTLRMMLGLTRPTTGAVTYDRLPYHKLADLPAVRIGATLTSDAFSPRRSAWQHLWCWAPLANAPKERIEQVLELVGLTEVTRRPVGTFSLGMKQRLALATALLGNPDVLILDEPANGLDPHGIYWLRGFLRRFADQGGTVVLSSHLLSEMQQMVDDVVLIDKGRVVWRAAMNTVTTDLPWAVALCRNPSATASLLRNQGLEVEAVGRGLRVQATAGVVSRAISESPHSDRVTVLAGNLESLFLALTDEMPEVY